jgi:anti-sigma factor RsiW
MIEPDTLPNHVHPEEALLPWYANGTLSETEREQVAAHLETCRACRIELEEIKSLKADLTKLYAAQPGPSPKTARFVLGAAAQDVAARRTNPVSDGSWMDRVDQWLRSLFTPRWVPTLAATILIAQVGLLLWITMPATQPGQVTTRSLGMQTARIRVVFQEAATEEQIRSLLQTIRGRIVDGPNPNGLYIIEVLAADAETSREKFERLRARIDVVRSADLDTL